MPYLGNILSVGSSAVTASASALTPFTNTYSLDFDGIDDYAAIADSDDLSFGNGSTDSAFSGMAWVKMDDATNFRIFSKTQDTNNREYLFNFDANDKLTIVLYDLDLDNKLKVRYDTASTALEGSWHHVAFTYDGSGLWTGITLYIDGSAVTPYNTSTGTYVAMHNTTGSLDIGRWNLSGYANGKIDEVVIIPSELSAAQITAIYNGGEPADLTSYSPTLWTRFEEGTGTSIADSSGNGHTATLTNGPTFSTDVPVYVFNRYSVDFDGTDDYAIVDNSGGEFSFGNASSDTAFSGSAWIKFDSATNFQILTCADGSSTDVEWQFRVLNGGQLYACLFDANASNSIRCTATSTLSTGTWYHVGFSYDGSGSETGLNLYLNGSPIAATQAEVGTYIAMHAQSTEVRIGSLNYDTDQFANGKIDEPAIFGSELSAEQFLAIYNGGEPASLTSYSPIGWWRFEEGTGTSIADSSGNGHTATLTNGPTFSTDVPAAAAFTNTYSVDFDGTDDYAAIADANDLSFGNGSTDSAFSIMAWVKMDDATNFRIAAKSVSTNNREWLFTTDPNDKFSLTFYDPDAANSILSRYDTALTSFEGQWIHVCGTYDGSGNNSGLSLYLNGSPVATVEVTSGSYVAMSNTVADVTIGRWNVSGYANGKIDEVAIIPSELSAAQITAIYNSGVPVDLTSYSPIGWWRMGDNDGGTGTTITDQGSGGNDATLTNGPTFSTNVPT